VDPRTMGIGPVPAARRALERAGLTLDDMDLVEVNEAFAAQYLAVEQELGLDRERTNVDGGAVALGHPLGASGARITLHLLHALRRRGGRYGLGAACIGGGQGISVTMEILVIGLGVAVVYSFLSLRVLKQYERGVAFFLGRYWGTKGPGVVFLPALFAGQKRVSLRIVALDIPPQDVITRDNVSVKVNAVLYMRVGDPAKAVIEIEDYLYATSQLAQTTLRSVLGEVELDELLSDREKINAVLKKIIDERTDPWGIEVSAVEVKDVDLPDQMKRAMARQAEAERERRAKVIAAQGELQASETLAQAAHTLAKEPTSLQLRYLQTVTEIAAENNSTTIFPVPIELFRPFLQAASKPAQPKEKGEPETPALSAGELSSLMSQLRIGAARTSQE
jgi:regulator of protease activity HflC (stomatin/prohibitin superfamily)